MKNNSHPSLDTVQAAHSPELLAHALSPRNLGLLPNPDGYGAPRGECGDLIEIGLRINGEVIVDTSFISDGCAYTVACGSLLTELVRGLSLNAALEITSDQVVDSLGGLPADHRHCADLAVGSLRLAVRDYLIKRIHPWKAFYQRG